MVLNYALHVHFSVDGLRCLNGSNENSDGFSGYSGNCVDLNCYTVSVCVQIMLYLY